MKLRFALAVFLLVLLHRDTLHCQLIEDQKKAVAFLFGEIHPKGGNGAPVLGPNGRPIVINAAIGTAFFIGFPDERGGAGFEFAYIVTCKHVLREADGSLLPWVAVRLNLKAPTMPTGYEFMRLPVVDDKGNLLWLDDPDNPSDDVALLPFLPDLSKFDYKVIPSKLFLTKEVAKQDRFTEGDSLYFIGLLPQYYGQNKNYPVVRKGSVALITDELLDTPTGKQAAYIAEIAAWPGNSGSPVFVNLGGMRAGNLTVGESFAFVGLLEGYFMNRAPVEATETAQAFMGDPSNIGISFVVPADSLLHVLNSAKAKEYRDRELKTRGIIK
jgi:hypothetical protein